MNSSLVKQTRMYKDLRGMVEQSMSVSDGFVSRFGGDLVNAFCVSLEEAYLDNTSECPVALTDVSGAGATSVS